MSINDIDELEELKERPALWPKIMFEQLYLHSPEQKSPRVRSKNCWLQFIHLMGFNANFFFPLLIASSSDKDFFNRRRWSSRCSWSFSKSKSSLFTIYSSFTLNKDTPSRKELFPVSPYRWDVLLFFISSSISSKSIASNPFCNSCLLVPSCTVAPESTPAWNEVMVQLFSRSRRSTTGTQGWDTLGNGQPGIL